MVNRLRAALLVVAAGMALEGVAFGQNCPAAVPNDNTTDNYALQACLDAGTELILTPGTYWINDKIRFRSDDKKLTSVGGKATLKAQPDLNGPIIEVQGANGYVISELILDGNKANRAFYSECYNSGNHFPGQAGSNGFFSGNDYKLHHIDTINAMCGSGLQVKGNNFEVYSVYAARNGKMSSEAPGIEAPWADGITLERCDGGYVHDNNIVDNTDVGLFVFRGVNCSIQHNTITQTTRYAFEGLGMGDPFANSSFSGTTVWYNTITIALNKATRGLGVGPHTGGLSFAWTTNAGSVRYNSISGAVVNLAVDGIQGGTVTNNTTSNAQGSQGLVCGTAANYTAGHFTGATVSGGYVCRAYDAGCSCQN